MNLIKSVNSPTSRLANSRRRTSSRANPDRRVLKLLLLVVAQFAPTTVLASELGGVHLVSESPGVGAPASFFQTASATAPIGDTSIARRGQIIAFTLTPDADDRNWLPSADLLAPAGKTNVYSHDRRSDRTRLISRNHDGNIGNGNSIAPSVSANGKFIAFTSDSTNLVPNVMPSTMQLYVADLTEGTLQHIDMGIEGGPNGTVSDPSLSDNGRFIAFASDASNLSNLADGQFDQVYLHDRLTNRTKLISVGIDQTPPDAGSVYPQVSANGNCVLFRSLASNIHSGGPGVMVYQRDTDEMKFVQPRGLASISGDCNYVAFGARDLLPGDNDGYDDVYIQNLETSEIEQIDVSDDGETSNHYSFVGFAPFVSDDGRYVSFTSSAWNLVDNDVPSQWAGVIDPPFPGGATYDVFLRDRVSNQTICLSQNEDGEPLNKNAGGPWDSDFLQPGPSNQAPSIAADGSAVAFVAAGYEMLGVDLQEPAYNQVFVASNRQQTVDRQLQDGDELTDSVEARNWNYYSIESAGFSRLSVSIDQLDVNADLYISEEVVPNLSLFDCKSSKRRPFDDQCDVYNFGNTNKTWMIGVRGRSKDASYRLTARLSHAWPMGMSPALMKRSKQTFAESTFPGRSDDYAVWVPSAHELTATLTLGEGGRARLFMRQGEVEQSENECVEANPGKDVRRCISETQRQKKLWFVRVLGLQPSTAYRLRMDVKRAN